MSGISPGRIELDGAGRSGVDWTARIALGAAGAFTLLLGGFGLILVSSWPEPTKVRTALASAATRMDRMATEQQLMSADLGSLRRDLRDDRAERLQGGAEVAQLRARVAELSGTVGALRDQTERLTKAGEQARPDPAVDELRQRLGTMQERLDQIAAAVAASPARGGAPLPGVSPAAAAARAAGANGGVAEVPSGVKRATVTANPATVAMPAARQRSTDVDEIDREVRDMEAVIRASERARGASVGGGVLIPGDKPRSVAFVTPRREGASTIADPLAPMTSKTEPRVAPVKGFVTPRPAGVPTASVVPGPVSDAARANEPEREVRVTSVGVNSAQRAIGPLGLPFDAVGNLLAAIGEGLDRLLTGRVYVSRPEEAPATARLNR